MPVEGIGVNNINLDPGNAVKSASNSETDNADIGSEFGKFLKNSIQKLNDLQQTTEQDNLLVASGNLDSLPQVMVNAQKAELSLQLAVQIRNKVVDAYNEIMRMPF